jgi:hypothetical protein
VVAVRVRGNSMPAVPRADIMNNKDAPIVVRRG